ncbi:basic proline-rich protein-like isoform X1 [Gopherus evgoodei]|uniref:basic proline-rich protein-like isoform X1 n=1 Tax=Gopherus evgoodei TaxID=1825980 RepID=UPI0011CFED38|nr:basic proline-rich protein-like isoform X1 [Gopherus evgoodei]
MGPFRQPPTEPVCLPHGWAPSPSSSPPHPAAEPSPGTGPSCQSCLQSRPALPRDRPLVPAPRRAGLPSPGMGSFRQPPTEPVCLPQGWAPSPCSSPPHPAAEPSPGTGPSCQSCLQSRPALPRDRPLLPAPRRAGLPSPGMGSFRQPPTEPVCLPQGWVPPASPLQSWCALPRDGPLPPAPHRASLPSPGMGPFRQLLPTYPAAEPSPGTGPSCQSCLQSQPALPRDRPLLPAPRRAGLPSPGTGSFRQPPAEPVCPPQGWAPPASPLQSRCALPRDGCLLPAPRMAGLPSPGTGPSCQPCAELACPPQEWAPSTSPPSCHSARQPHPGMGPSWQPPTEPACRPQGQPSPPSSPP